MSKKELVKSAITSYCIIVTLVCADMLFMGCVFQPDMRFGYEAFLSPLLYGFLGIIPIVVTYSKKELTVRHFFFRKVLQLISVLLIVIFIGYGTNNISKGSVMQNVTMGLSVVLIYLAVNAILALINASDAKKLDRLLQEYKR